MRRAGDAASDLDLHVVAFGERRRDVLVGLLLDDVIGRRRGVAQHHRGLALGEQAVGLAPALGDREDARLEPGPGFAGLVAIDFLDPEHEAEAGRARPRILQHDLLAGIALDQLLEARRRFRQLGLVVHDREVAVVVGHEHRIGPGDR
jgi:hypothetical protein